MSKQLKERIIYIISMALGLLVIASLFFPFVTVSKTITDSYGAITMHSEVISGFKMVFVGMLEYCKAGREAEALFVVFSILCFGLALASIALGFLFLRGSKKNPEKVYPKKWFIIFQLVMTALSFVMILSVNNYVDYLNTKEGASGGWSHFETYFTTGIYSKVGPCSYIMCILSAIGLVGTSVFTGMAKDNSLVFPYKRREIISACITIVACALVFFLPLFDFYYTTAYLNDNASTIYTITSSLGADPTQQYITYDGYLLFSQGGGGMAGFLKVVLYLMVFVGIVGIVYNVVFLLAAAKLIKINFDRKLSNIINLTLMVMGILIFVGCAAYCIGVNFQLDTNYKTYSMVYDFDSIWGGSFPHSYMCAGSILSLFPVASFAGVFFVNNYLD